MEGAGSRQSRASSRYASSPSPAAFNGPVRKWRKQWVTSLSDTQNRPGKRNDSPPLLLCRWTPLSAADEPPRRRRRYTPIVPIEKGGNMMKSMENEGRGSMSFQSNNGAVDVISKEEAQEVNEDEADTEEY